MDRPFPSRASSSGDFAPDEPSKPYGLPRTMEEHREFLKNYKVRQGAGDGRERGARLPRAADRRRSWSLQLRPEDTEVLRNCSERVISDSTWGT